MARSEGALIGRAADRVSCSGSATVGAESVDLDRVVRLREPLGVGEGIELVVERLLERGGERGIANQAARLTDQVVMVPGER